MVSSFNYAIWNGTLSISQCQGIISLIAKKKKNTEDLKIGDLCLYWMYIIK